MRKSFNLLCCLFVQFTVFSQIQYGQRILTDSGKLFHGWSVSLPDSETLAVGAPYQIEPSNIGSVKVYSYSGGDWILKGKEFLGESPGQLLGYAVKMPDRSTIAILIPGAVLNGKAVGCVRVYRWLNQDWIQKGNAIFGDFDQDFFEGSIDMPDSNIIAVGAKSAKVNGVELGRVRIYRWDGNDWVQKGNDILGPSEFSAFGASVDMPNPNFIAVGLPFYSDSGNGEGQVKIYKWRNNIWELYGSPISGKIKNELSGISVSMPDTSCLAIGAYSQRGTGGRPGQARVYTFKDGEWNQRGADLTGEKTGDEFGFSLSMPHPDFLAVGAPKNDRNGQQSGIVRIYQWRDGNWSQYRQVIVGDTSSFFGYSVSMADTNHIAVGGPFFNGNGKSGKVLTFKLNQTLNSVVKNDYPPDFSVFPNPTQGDVNVLLGRNYGQIMVIVRNNLGQVVFNKNYFNTEHLKFNLNVPPGFYQTAVITDEQNHMMFKIFRQ